MFSSSSASAIATVLTTQLPILMTADDVEKNPDFTKMLEHLAAHHLTSQGASRNVQEQLNQRQAIMDREKTAFMQCLVVITELKELLEDNCMSLLSRVQSEPSSSSSSSSSSSRVDNAAPTSVAVISGRNKLLDTVSRILEVLEMEQFLPIDCGLDDSLSGEVVNMLGVTVSEFRKVRLGAETLSPPDIKALQQGLVPLLEDQLQRKCELLADFYDPPLLSNDNNASSATSIQTTKSQASTSTTAATTTTTTTTTTLTSILQLPARVSERRARLQQGKDQARVESLAVETQRWSLFRVLARSVEILIELISEYKLRHFAEADNLKIKWLIERCRTMYLKLEVLKHQFQKETYHPEAVQALRLLREQLQNAQQQANEEQQRLKDKVQQYERVGSDFSKLVEQYASLTEQIRHKRWALERIHNGGHANPEGPALSTVR